MTEETRQHLCEYVGQLVVVRCWCGIQHAIPQALRSEQERMRDEGEGSKTVWCPLGHPYIVGGDSRVAKLEKQLAAKQARLDQAQAEVSDQRARVLAMDRRRRAEKGAKTRLKKRVAEGVCPCCQRTFKDLAEHMHMQHPEFGQQADRDEPAHE